MAEIRIGYFLEDIVHQRFLQTLVERIIHDAAKMSVALESDIRNATGGRGQVLENLQGFFRDVGREQDWPFDVVVVAIDGNCHGYREVRDQILARAEQADYGGPVACAVPNPHIERWYLEDLAAVRRVLGVDQVPALPRYKCERARCKNALREAIRRAGVIAPLGGAEYGQDISRELDGYVLGKTDPGFRRFQDALRQAVAPILRGPGST